MAVGVHTPLKQLKTCLSTTPWKYVGYRMQKHSALFNVNTMWRWVVGVTFQPLYPRGKSPGVRWILGWVGLRVSVNVVEKSKTPELS
jgi:hypothetical protein